MSSLFHDFFSRASPFLQCVCNSLVSIQVVLFLNFTSLTSVRYMHLKEYKRLILENSMEKPRIRKLQRINKFSSQIMWQSRMKGTEANNEQLFVSPLLPLF